MTIIAPGGIRGSIRLPPSKSHTLRAILFAALAEGTSKIENILLSPDTDAMIAACKKLGAQIIQQGTTLHICGKRAPQEGAVIDAGNSGIVLRFMAAVFATTARQVTCTGDESCQTRRPCLPLVEGLKQMGAHVEATNGFAPLTVQGPIHPAKVVIDGQDSQPVSALMIAAALLHGTTELEVQNLGERPWLGLTLDWLQRLGVKCHQRGDCFTITSTGELPSFCYRVPADLSSLAFPVALALISESDLVIEDVDLSDVQGDKVVLSYFEQMGAKILYNNKSLRIQGPQKLTGVALDVNDCIDALPILATVGCFATGVTHLYNAAVARKKESDRLRAMYSELSKMGATIVEEPEGLRIEQSQLRGCALSAHGDHRVAMALAVAASQAVGESVIEGADCVKKTYSNFFVELARLKELHLAHFKESYAKSLAN